MATKKKFKVVKDGLYIYLEPSNFAAEKFISDNFESAWFSGFPEKVLVILFGKIQNPRIA